MNTPKQDHVELLLTSADLPSKKSTSLEKIHFPNERYRKFAEIVQRLSILESSEHINHQLLEAAGLVGLPREVSEREKTILEAKREMHDLLLKKHSFPNGPRLMISPSDREFNYQYTSEDFDFRDEDAANLAHHLHMVAAFQDELNGHFENRYDLDEPERKSMIEDTDYRLHQSVDHLNKILTGFFKR